MKGNVFFGTVFSAALAMSVAAAQTTGSQTDPQSQQKEQQSQQGQQVTVVGCLQSADIAGGAAGTTGTGTTGTAGQQTSRAQFMLTHAKITSGGMGTTGTGGTGTSGTTGTSKADTKFLLMGGNQQELRQYVNSQVEIRGTWHESGAAGGGAGTGYGTGTEKSSTSSDMKTLRVTSVKQISPTCTDR